MFKDELKLRQGVPPLCPLLNSIEQSLKSGYTEKAQEDLNTLREKIFQLRAYGRYWMVQATGDTSITYNPKYLNW